MSKSVWFYRCYVAIYKDSKREEVLRRIHHSETSEAALGLLSYFKTILEAGGQEPFFLQSFSQLSFPLYVFVHFSLYSLLAFALICMSMFFKHILNHSIT